MCWGVTRGANSFGGPFPEHEVMAAWLKARGCPNVQTPPLIFLLHRYLGQRGRVALLARPSWPMGAGADCSGCRIPTRAPRPPLLPSQWLRDRSG
jgi:hypothetical protein